MIEMPPLQFAETNGIRMGYYEAGPKTDTPPVILCHGWPEIAFSWRHQIKALAAAGIRVIAPDQRGYGATERPEPIEAYDIEHLTGDLVGLLDHLGIDKAIFVGHDWGGFVVWQMPLRHIDRVAGVVGVNTPHTDRAPADPIELLRKRAASPARAVQIPRTQSGEFALKARINGVSAPMVIDTGATSVVLTYETAKAAGLPLELLEYDVDVETAGGHTRAARLTLDRLAIGKLVERSVPALVVPQGQMKTNLLGMSFLDRLESWDVHADRLMLHGYP